MAEQVQSHIFGQGLDQGEGVGDRAFGKAAMFQGVDTLLVAVGELFERGFVVPQVAEAALGGGGGAVQQNQRWFAIGGQAVDLTQFPALGGTAVEAVAVLKPCILKAACGHQGGHRCRSMAIDAQSLDDPGTKAIA